MIVVEIKHVCSHRLSGRATNVLNTTAEIIQITTVKIKRRQLLSCQSSFYTSNQHVTHIYLIKRTNWTLMYGLKPELNACFDAGE